MKKTIVFIIGALLMAAFLCLYFVLTLACQNKETVENRKNSQLKPAYENKEIVKNTKISQLKVDYPIFDHKIIQHDIDAFIKENITSFEQLPPPPTDIPVHYINDLNISYDTPFISDRTISVAFYVMLFTGGAHPNTTVICRNYDAKTGQSIQLADVCATGKAVLRKMLIDKIMKTIDEPLNPPNKQWIINGVNSNKLENFTMGPGHLTFYFNQYEVAPYALGIQKVEVQNVFK